MCIYCSTNNYRKIYENHHGPIPKEENGRSYHIHHIDGNHNNSDPSNLRAVTLQEHYDIHYAQGDWAACRLLLVRLSQSPDELSRMASEFNYRQVRDKTHPFLGGEIQRTSAKKQLNAGTHNFQVMDPIEKSNRSKETNKRRLKDGTHNFLDKENASLRNIKRAAEGKHPAQIQVTCPHCGKTGMMSRHFGYCKLNPGT